MFPLLLAALSPALALSGVDARGCGAITVSGRPVEGGPAGLCVKEVVWAPLEGGLVAALVEAPHRFDPQLRNRVFVYRLEGRKLIPRFLGSGFSRFEIAGLFPGAESLGLEVVSAGKRATLSCRFDGFPLVCTETP